MVSEKLYFSKKIVFRVLLAIVFLVFVGNALLALKKSASLDEIHSRNNQRKHDLETIVSAVDWYFLHHGKERIDKIPDAYTEICRPHAADCTGMVDLAALLDDYPIPADPYASKVSKGTRYAIRVYKTSKANQYDRGFMIDASALDAELGEQITAFSR